MVSPMAFLFLITALISAFCTSSQAAAPKTSFEDNFSIMFSEDHFKTSEDGNTWFLSLDKQTGCGFQTKERYRFRWFSMKLKLLRFEFPWQMCSEKEAGPVRDEVDFEFLGNRTGQPYLIQTNVFFVDRVPIRVFKNNGDKRNDFFPNKKPVYLFSSIWNADDWATRGGVEKTDWKRAPFVSSYKDFSVDGCQWEDPYPACVSTTSKYWWDQYDAWHLTDDQKKDFAWMQRNLVIYDYCKDFERYPKLPGECS
ncbi:putative xyloglucan endotransglucosylase/hydrolase protein 8 [Hibiscus syriacus]|uniref:Xyloglucan endotransglucosylase/hydrolase n=1 Tax=Hibiscus syriacus TaxID=106335 RepID=A0A6A3CMR8_HIBSY|nr:putative xyloglucan endotransglucosylase/hydrolase protein 8 [Hibiscus syriacus]